MRQVAQSVSMSLCRSSMGKDGLEKTIALLLAVHSFSGWPVGRSIVQHPGPQHPQQQQLKYFTSVTQLPK